MKNMRRTRSISRFAEDYSQVIDVSDVGKVGNVGGVFSVGDVGDVGGNPGKTYKAGEVGGKDAYPNGINGRTVGIIGTDDKLKGPEDVAGMVGTIGSTSQNNSDDTWTNLMVGKVE